MKKIISIILSLALVVCMFSMTVSAATITANPGKNHVVGGQGESGTIADGKLDSEFSSESAQIPVTLNLTSFTSRYAVDITFGGDAYTFDATGIHWDVNALAYVATDNAVVANKTYDFTVTNYSDKAVKVVAACEVPDAVAAAGVTCEFGDVDGNDVVANGTYDNHTINGNANTTDGTVNNSTFSATIKSGNWATTINTLVGTTTVSTITLATFTVTVSKVS